MKKKRMSATIMDFVHSRRAFSSLLPPPLAWVLPEADA
jgi:hypothetical protein